MYWLKKTILPFAVLAGPVFSAPRSPVEVASTLSPPSPTISGDIAHGGHPTGAVRIAGDDIHLEEPPELLTIEITNYYGDTITTSHASNVGCPTPVSGALEPGTVPNGTSTYFAVPTGWAGNIAFNRGNMPVTDDVTLIEASFVTPEDWPVAVVDVDVSLVNGYTVPITCACDGSWVSGCKKDLFGGHSTEIAVPNPHRDDDEVMYATPFFKPCAGAAYTFPKDHGANSFGACQGGLVSCCVGTACPISVPRP